MLKVITLFTGIGAQEAALKRLNIPFEVVGISEIDKYAIQSYNAINGPTFNYGDITKIPLLDYADLWTYSFPCQDLSVAGKQAGITEGTRSGLLLHVERLLETAVLIGNQPKYLLLENVKALVSKKFKPDFERWLVKLELLGYNNYWQVLNAKDYGVPQNRERVFVVSIRKDVDTKGYKFPEKIPLTRKLKDVLEPVVDEKYYLSDKIVNTFLNRNVINKIKGNGFKFEPTTSEKYSKTITTRAGSRPDDNYIQEPLARASRGRNPENPSDRTTGVPTEQRLEVNTSGCSNTLTSVQKDNYIIVPEATKQGYAKAYDGDSINLDQPNSETRRGRVGHQIANTLTCACNQAAVQQVGNIVETESFGGNPQRGRIYSADGCSPALNCCQGGGLEPKILKNYRIRKLTPLECWRLMDFTDEEFYCAQLSGVSNSQLYKQAGNSIVIAVLQAIFKELLA